MEPAAAAHQRLNNFDLLRLIAATQVCVCHGLLYLEVPWSLAVGYGLDLFPGVNVFFLMSGFLIAGSLERHLSQPGEYFRNRAMRIYPAVWACLGVSVASVLLIRPEIFRQAEWRDVGIWVAAQLSVVQFWNPDFLRGYGVGVLNGSLWTIPVEMQFYVALPVLYRIFGWHRHRRNLALAALVLVLGLINFHMKLLDDTVVHDRLWFKLYRQTFVPNLFMFMLGVLVKRNFHYIRPLVAGRAKFWFLIYAPVLYMGFWLGISGWNPVTQALLAMFVVACAYTKPGLSEGLLRGNDISYGAYLYNMVVINFMRELGLMKRPVYILIEIAAIYALAMLSWRFVEKPALALKSRRKVASPAGPRREASSGEGLPSPSM